MLIEIIINTLISVNNLVWSYVINAVMCTKNCLYLYCSVLNAAIICIVAAENAFDSHVWCASITGVTFYRCSKELK